jgi:transposase
MFLTQRKALASAEARAMALKTNTRDQALLIDKLEHQIARLRHERSGQSWERRVLLDQLELQLFELKEDKAEAEMAPQTDQVQSVEAFTRRKPARRPLPEHLRVPMGRRAGCTCSRLGRFRFPRCYVPLGLRDRFHLPRRLFLSSTLHRAGFAGGCSAWVT